jgi:hypothetical protein
MERPGVLRATEAKAIKVKGHVSYAGLLTHKYVTTTDLDALLTSEVPFQHLGHGRKEEIIPIIKPKDDRASIYYKTSFCVATVVQDRIILRGLD